MKRKLLILLLTAVVTLAALPGAALAAEGATGWDGDFQWTELADGTVAVTNYSGGGGAVTIPDTLGGKTVTGIVANAFPNPASVTSLSLPSTLKSIGDRAFAGFMWLLDIDIPVSVTSIGDGAFNGCTFLQTVTLHDGLQRLGVQAFVSCGSLQSIDIPDSVTSIGDGAFYYCTGLESVTLPDNPAFTAIPSGLFKSCDTLTSVAIPSSVTSIGDQAFSGAGITSITIPAAVSSIGESVFATSRLTEFQVNPANTHYVSDGGVLYNIDKTLLIAYPNMAPATSFTVPATVTDIAPSAFVTVWNLTSITLPDHLQTIGSGAFVTQIAQITIPKSVTSIGNGAFYICPNLKKMVFLGKNVTFQGSSPFLMTALANDGIYGFDGSDAQTLATAKNIPFHFLYTVSFQSEGSAVDDVIAEEGQTIAAPADPTRPGYHFTRWCKDSALTDPWDFATDTVTGDITLHAQWMSTSTPTASPTPTPTAAPTQTATASPTAAPTAAPQLLLALSPANGKIYTGGRVTIEPSIPGGTWSFDSKLLSRDGNTFTGLKTGTARVTYTVGSESVHTDIVIAQAELPQTGQDFSPALWLLALAACAAGAALALRARRKERA